MMSPKRTKILFEWLEQQGVTLDFYKRCVYSNDRNPYIYELTPNIYVSQSRFLEEKYKHPYRTFLIAQNFEEYNSLKVEGCTGTLQISDGETYLIIEPTIEERKEGHIDSKKYIQKLESYRTLLIQGQLNQAWALAKSSLNKVFCEITSANDDETYEVYQELTDYINQFHKEVDSKYYLYSKGFNTSYQIHSEIFQNPDAESIIPTERFLRCIAIYDENQIARRDKILRRSL